MCQLTELDQYVEQLWNDPCFTSIDNHMDSDYNSALQMYHPFIQKGFGSITQQKDKECAALCYNLPDKL